MSVKAALVGTWKMVSWTREVVATGEISDAMGPNPIGYIAYHAAGRMMALVLKRDRPAPAGAIRPALGSGYRKKTPRFGAFESLPGLLGGKGAGDDPEMVAVCPVIRGCDSRPHLDAFSDRPPSVVLRLTSDLTHPPRRRWLCTRSSSSARSQPRSASCRSFPLKPW